MKIFSRKNIKKINRFAGYLILTIAVIQLHCAQDSSSPQFKRQIPWTGKGVWIKMDPHTHTSFSDGRYSLAKVVEQAANFGCDAIAITDHGDGNLDAATPAYFQAIQEARQTHPDMIILSGLEWNIPPYGGDEHVNVIISPGANEEKILAEFKIRFDDYKREQHEAKLALDGLKWLESNFTSGMVLPVVVYNHPSRKDSSSMENVADYEKWRSANNLLIGFSGAPGHQREGKYKIGSYTHEEETIDRWDPVAARIGDAWDVLLQKGYDVFAALSVSDFHNDFKRGLHDFWPGEFSETWVYAPERSAEGILRALRAGAFFGEHGFIVREVNFTVTAPGLSRPAAVGEIISVATGSEIIVNLTCQIPATDWERKANRLDFIELISITNKDARVVAKRPPASGDTVLTEKITVPKGGLILRARGGREIEDDPNQLFYTNPIRIETGN